MNKHLNNILKVSLLIAVTILSKTTLGNQNLLIFGDSLSSGYGISMKNSWPKLLDNKIKEKQLSLTIINRSISGETTSGGIRRLPKLLSEFSPSIVIIELGANDALRGLSLKQTKKNLTTMVELSKKIGSKPLIVGMRIPPNYGKAYSERFFNMFGQIAMETEIPIVPFMFKGFATDKNFFLNDQIHPNEKAQRKILENIWGELELLL